MLMTDGNTKLYLVEPSPAGFKPLASAVILEPGDNWAPLALVDGKLLVRGQKELKVLQVAQVRTAPPSWSVSPLRVVLGAAAGVMAQALKDVQTADTPLVLKAQGSFFVGGDKVEQTQGELGDLGPGGHITVNQMYVRYMVPQGGDGNVPVVMVHGATLTGKSWETTPDGRMGWDEYFVRKGHPVYVPDQVGRGRSGFNQAVFNNVRAGSAPATSLPRWLRSATRASGRTSASARSLAQPFPDSQFPVTAVDELVEAGCARRQLRRRAHAQPDAQGVGRSRRPVEWRGVDGTLAVRIVSAGSGAAQSRCGERSRARRAGQLPGAVTPPNRSRHWRRCRSWSCSAITATRRPAFRRCPHGRPDSRRVRR